MDSSHKDSGTNKYMFADTKPEQSEVKPDAPPVRPGYGLGEDSQKKANIEKDKDNKPMYGDKTKDSDRKQD